MDCKYQKNICQIVHKCQIQSIPQRCSCSLSSTDVAACARLPPDTRLHAVALPPSACIGAHACHACLMMRIRTARNSGAGAG
jgi:hypothetical protein